MYLLYLCRSTHLSKASSLVIFT